jgi:hypothetical protein
MCKVKCMNEEKKDADKGPCPVKIILVKRSLVALILLVSLLVLFTAGAGAADPPNVEQRYCHGTYLGVKP